MFTSLTRRQIKRLPPTIYGPKDPKTPQSQEVFVEVPDYLHDSDDADGDEFTAFITWDESLSTYLSEDPRPGHKIICPVCLEGTHLPLLACRTKACRLKEGLACLACRSRDNPRVCAKCDPGRDTPRVGVCSGAPSTPVTGDTPVTPLPSSCRRDGSRRRTRTTSV